MPDIVANLRVFGPSVVHATVPEFREEYGKRDAAEGIPLLYVDIFGVQKLLDLLNFCDFLAAQCHITASLLAQGVPHKGDVVVVGLERSRFR